MQVMVDNLIPFPVVVERLHGQRNQDNPPNAKIEISQANVSKENCQNTEEDKAKRIRQAIHRRNKAGRVAMACHKVDRTRHHEKYRTVNREIMAQPFHDGNANSRKDSYPCNAQIKATSHRLRIERPHQVAIARDVGRLDGWYVSAEHALGDADNCIDDLHREGVDTRLI